MIDKKLKELWEAFRTLGEEALIMNHYDLAERTGIVDHQLWKQFLMEPEVSEWITSEFVILQQSELRNMIKDISKSNSVGQAQLMNQLSKLNEGTNNKSGPIFIYSYVPLSSEQEQGENIVHLKSDPFLKKGDL